MKEKYHHHLNMWNLDKKKPHGENYDKLIIPQLERLTKNLMLQDVVYNDIVYYYNKGITKGDLKHIELYGSDDKRYKIHFAITKNNIKIEKREIRK